MEKLATKYPYKNSASASTSYRNAKRRLLEIDTAGAADGSAANSVASPSTSAANSATTTPKKRSPVKRKQPVPIDSEAAAGPADEATGSPKPKRQRKTPVKKATAAKSKELVEEEYVISCPTLVSPMPEESTDHFTATRPTRVW